MSRNPTCLPPLDPLQRYTMCEAAAYLRVSRQHLYALIAKGQLKTVRDGKRRYIPGTVIAARSAAPQQ